MKTFRLFDDDETVRYLHKPFSMWMNLIIELPKF
jgi:hypothetical protein